MNWHDLSDTIISTIYLLGVTVIGYVGWMVIKLLKLVTPQASKVVAKIVSDWIIDLLRPIIQEAIDQKIGNKLDDLEKIRDATHGKKEAQEGVMLRLLEIAEKLEKQANGKDS